MGNIGATAGVFSGAISGVTTITANGAAKFTGVNRVATLVTANASVSAGNTYIVGTAGITLTLPASAVAGDSISFIPRPGVTTYTISNNGLNVMGSAQSISVDILKPFGVMYDNNSTYGWLMTN